MKLATLLPICSDLSEVAVEEALKIAGNPENFSLVVGVKHASYARSLKIKEKAPWIWVNPDWTTEWMLSSKHSCIFSEGV